MLLEKTIAGCLIALGVTLLMPRALFAWGIWFGLRDHPGTRRLHARATPLTGGLSMFVAALVGGVLLLSDCGPGALGFTVAATLIVMLGVYDDKKDLSWKLRIPGQAMVALVMIYAGGIRVDNLGDVFGSPTFALGPLSVPITVVATVGIINAMNMIDGIDGLAGFLAMCALLMLESAALYVGNDLLYSRAPIVIGAVAGFLLLNMQFPWQSRARIFMGSSGSGFLGLVIAAFAFKLTQTPTLPVSPVLALWLLPVPIVDCLVVMVRRVRSGVSPFAADRNHVHHLMLEGGFGPTQTLFLLGLLSLLSWLLVAAALRASVPSFLLFALFGALCVSWYWTTSDRTRAVAFFRRLHDGRIPVIPPADAIPK